MGSGKSTLSNLLIDRCCSEGENRLVNAKTLRLKIFLNEQKQVSFLNYVFWKFILLIRPIKYSLIGGLQATHTENAWPTESNDWQEFLAFVLKSCPIPKKARTFGFLLRLLHFMNDLRLNASIQSLNQKGYAVLDEGILQRGISMNLGTVDPHFCETYYRLCPLPNLLVAIKGTTKLFEKRCRSRTDLNVEHMEFADDATKVFNLALPILISRTKKIIVVDANDPLKDQFKQVISKIPQLQHTTP